MKSLQLRMTRLLPLIFLFHAINAQAGIFDSPQPAATSSSETPAEFRRGAEQTFLTFPEWFLVYSPAEYADYVKTHAPTAFPFLCHIRQFWQGYSAVYEATRKDYPFNFGYHVMIAVIGSSTTVEYGIRAVYEGLIGRVSELTQSGGLTEEDRYGAEVAQDYVDFIRVRPWYEYNFAGKLAGLWRNTPFIGKDMLRKWERKYALTTEYLAKAIYGWMIKIATGTAYDPAAETTAVVLDRVPENISATLPQLKSLQLLASKRTLAELPRYHAFMQYASTLAQQGVAFHEIAGNRDSILISVLCSTSNCMLPAGTQTLFEQDILTAPGNKRIVLTVPVASLSSMLTMFAAQGVSLEHIYDY
jgi:hypothetical protein